MKIKFDITMFNLKKVFSAPKISSKSKLRNYHSTVKINLNKVLKMIIPFIGNPYLCLYKNFGQCHVVTQHISESMCAWKNAATSVHSISEITSV